MQTIGKKRE